MNVTAKASRVLRTLPAEDAAVIVDTAERTIQRTPRRLVTMDMSLPGGRVSIVAGRPVSSEDESVLLAVTIEPWKEAE